MRRPTTLEPTRYELVAVKGDRTILIGYTSRKNRAGGLALLVGMVTSSTRTGEHSGTVTNLMRVTMLAAKTGTTPEAWQTARGVIAECDGWIVRFSGRTQRDACASGAAPESIYAE